MRGKISGAQGWYPWIIVSIVVIVWTVAKIFLIGDVKIPWPGLDKAVFITLYNTPYGAIWVRVGRDALTGRGSRASQGAAPGTFSVKAQSPAR